MNPRQSSAFFVKYQKKPSLKFTFFLAADAVKHYIANILTFLCILLGLDFFLGMFYPERGKK